MLIRLLLPTLLLPMKAASGSTGSFGRVAMLTAPCSKFHGNGTKKKGGRELQRRRKNSNVSDGGEPSDRFSCFVHLGNGCIYNQGWRRREFGGAYPARKRARHEYTYARAACIQPFFVSHGQRRQVVRNKPLLARSTRRVVYGTARNATSNVCAGARRSAHEKRRPLLQNRANAPRGDKRSPPDAKQTELLLFCHIRPEVATKEAKAPAQPPARETDSPRYDDDSVRDHDRYHLCTRTLSL